MKKFNSLLIAVLVAGTIGILYSFSTEKVVHGDAIEMGPGWKNLKVLPQDISRDSLFALMNGYSASLGVSCTFCHAVGADGKPDFPADSKHEKLIARSMIEMTNEINAKYFDPYRDPQSTEIQGVTCVTCHRGAPNPRTYLNNVGNLYRHEPQEKH